MPPGPPGHHKILKIRRISKIQQVPTEQNKIKLLYLVLIQNLLEYAWVTITMLAQIRGCHLASWLRSTLGQIVEPLHSPVCYFGLTLDNCYKDAELGDRVQWIIMPKIVEPAPAQLQAEPQIII